MSEVPSRFLFMLERAIYEVIWPDIKGETLCTNFSDKRNCRLLGATRPTRKMWRALNHHVGTLNSGTNE